MRSGSRTALIAVLALLTVLAATAGPVQAATGASGARQVGSEEPGATTIVVDLAADGDARWTVTARFNLTTRNETAAFRELAAAFEAGEGDTLGLGAFRRASSLAAESTGRSMEITGIERTVSPESVVENGTGRLSLSFTWTNFARTDGPRLSVGDAFRTPDGVWFPRLTADQTLIVRPPDGFGVVNASVAPQNRTLQWTGPVRLGSGSLSATFTGANGPSGPGTPDDDSDSILWAGLFTLSVGVVVAAYLFVRRRGSALPTGPGETGTEPAPDPASDAAPGTDGDAGADADSDPEPEPEPVDEELLSDEERVERLLDRNGGRMKQANIVKETGWSNAKVSQLLSAMAEEERIDKLRIGRENLISFPDEEPGDTEE